MYEGGLFDQRPSVKYKHIILFIVVVVFVVCLSGELSMVVIVLPLTHSFTPDMRECACVRVCVRSCSQCQREIFS